MNENRVGLKKVKELEALDSEEILEGYWDGCGNERCGDNRSRSYWHGWRNGMVDGGHASLDETQLLLAREFVKSNRKTADR